MPAAKQYTHIKFTVLDCNDEAIQRLKECERIKHCLVLSYYTAKGSRSLEGWAHLKKRASLRLSEHMIESACGGVTTVLGAKRAEVSADIQTLRASGALEWQHDSAAASAMDVDDKRELSAKCGKWAKYFETMQEIDEAAKQADEKLKLSLHMDHSSLYEWQQRAAAYLITQEHNVIDWYVDPKGGEGKTHLAKWLIIKRKAYCLTNPPLDTELPEEPKEYVVFDLGRITEEEPPYELITAFKRGTHKTRAAAFGSKVIVFSNWEPDAQRVKPFQLNVVRLPEPSIWDICEDEEMIADKEPVPEPPSARDISSPSKRSWREMVDTDL